MTFLERENHSQEIQGEIERDREFRGFVCMRYFVQISRQIELSIRERVTDLQDSIKNLVNLLYLLLSLLISMYFVTYYIPSSSRFLASQ